MEVPLPAYSLQRRKFWVKCGFIHSWEDKSRDTTYETTGQ